jgi:S-adenosyl-L-methionine hydrolase (adenosine-forming)
VKQELSRNNGIDLKETNMKPSGIITLLTDFGLSDPYVAMMKGVILSINPDAVLVDISHSIPVGRIVQGAEMIIDSYPFFPKGTVHLVIVDPGVGSGRRLLGIEANGHFFVGPDNGIFWPMIKDRRNTAIINLTGKRYFLPQVTTTFHGRDIFAPVAAHLSMGEDLFRMGEKIIDPVKITIPSCHITDDVLYGEISRVDNFGNIITSIHGKELESFLKNDDPNIFIGDLELLRISRTYLDVEEGEPLALINSSGMLEIAVNLGRASEFTGIRKEELIGSKVRIKRAA